MKTVGLTGGIGSGKSTVAKIFAEKGIPVFEADKEAKKILANHPQAIAEVKNLLGNRAYNSNSEPDRKFIASKVFSDNHLLDQLNAIIHPKVHTAFKMWHSRQQSPYTIYEAAIIFEHGREGEFDHTILVVAEKDVKIKRVMERDQVTKEEVESRMNHQWDDPKKITKADFIIKNDKLENIKLKIDEIHKKLLE